MDLLYFGHVDYIVENRSKFRLIANVPLVKDQTIRPTTLSVCTLPIYLS